jgi:hypothetical protein
VDIDPTIHKFAPLAVDVRDLRVADNDAAQTAGGLRLRV